MTIDVKRWTSFTSLVCSERLLRISEDIIFPYFIEFWLVSQSIKKLSYFEIPGHDDDHDDDHDHDDDTIGG